MLQVLRRAYVAEVSAGQADDVALLQDPPCHFLRGEPERSDLREDVERALQSTGDGTAMGLVRRQPRPESRE